MKTNCILSEEEETTRTKQYFLIIVTITFGNPQPQPAALTSLQLVRAELNALLKQFLLIGGTHARPAIPHNQQQ